MSNYLDTMYYNAYAMSSIIDIQTSDLSQNRSEGIHCEVGGVAGCFGYSSHFLQNLFPFNGARRLHAFALCQFGDCRSACHRGNAAFGAKTDFGDPVAVEFHAQFQDVAANRIFDARSGVRLLDRARIARILKMIK